MVPAPRNPRRNEERGQKTERTGRRREEGQRNARRKRRGRRYLGTASIFKLVRPCAGTRGGNSERAEEGGGNAVAALSEFVRLKIYPMCTVYQAVAISIGAHGGVHCRLPPTPPEGSLSSLFLSPSLPPSLHPPFSPNTLLVYFLRAHLFASPG